MIKYYLTKTIHIHKTSSSTRISEDLPRLHTIETPDNNGYNMELNIKHSRVAKHPSQRFPHDTQTVWLVECLLSSASKLREFMLHPMIQGSFPMMRGEWILSRQPVSFKWKNSAALCPTLPTSWALLFPTLTRTLVHLPVPQCSLAGLSWLLWPARIWLSSTDITCLPPPFV